MKLFITIALFQILTSFSSFAQKSIIQGKVLDAETSEPLPFVSIALKGTPRGTSSNSMGEFQFRVDSLPAYLVFKHISYESVDLVVDRKEPITVKLARSKVILQDVLVKRKKKGGYLNGLITKAFERVQQFDNKSSYGKAYYRQLSKNGDDFTGLYEIFFDAVYSRCGIRNWAIQEGRYALKTSSNNQAYIYNKNFTLLCRVLSMIQPNSKDITHPISKEAKLYYDFKMKNLLNVEGRKIGVISFKPNRDVTGPAIEGELYLDVDNYDLLKISGRIKNDQLKFITLQMKGGQWKNYTLSFEMAYKISSGEDLALDYISLDQSFDYYLNDEFKHPVTTHALLSFYDYYVPEKRRRLGGRLSGLWQRDRDVLDTNGYNNYFWEENPIVKRTPVEKEVIASFESANAFGSIYLNNKENIVLSGYELNDDSVMVALSDSLRRSIYGSTGEKIYLHLDKTFYISGETLWFSVYLVNAASHVLSSSSGLVYVELIDTNKTVIVQKRVYMEDGGGYGQISLPNSLADGMYQLRAYTNWMRNFDKEWFFQQPLYIVNANDHTEAKKTVSETKGNIDIQFFAEGGELIAGIPVQVAFKAIDPDGCHVNVSGEVFDSSGKKITGFVSEHAGMGSFILLAQKDESYFAEIEGNSYEMPEVRSSGISIMVNVLKPEGIDMLIKATREYSDVDFYLVAQMRGIIFHRYKGRLQNMSAHVEMPRSKFPDGILQITLFDKNGIPLCERLTFINNEQTPYVKFNIDDNKLAPRKQVGVSMQLKNADGRTIQRARLSISVTDASLSPVPEYFEDISTWLLLNSDLKGSIEAPGYYFESDDKEHKRNLDLVMLTHGWRRFTWKAVLASASRKYPFPHESGINIIGRAYRKGTHKLMKNTLLRFIPINSFSENFVETLTDEKGNFGLHNVFVTDTTVYVVQGVNEKERQVKVEVLMDSSKTPGVVFEGINKATFLERLDFASILKGDEYWKFIQDLLKEDNTIILDEITVRSDKIHYDGQIYGTATNVIVLDDNSRHYSNVLQLLQGSVAGLMISGTGVHTTIMIRGYKSINNLNTTALILIDGVPMNSRSRRANNGLDLGVQALLDLPIEDVERIDILKGNAASIFGSQGLNGVIAVYTRTGQGLEPLPGMPVYEHMKFGGFSVERKFYIPDYKKSSETLGKPDYRSTLYWNPDVVISKNGWTNFNFFNNDHAKRLQVVIQGITEDGVPVTAVTWIGE